MSLFRAKSFSSIQAWMSRLCACNQRKKNEHLPQPAEQHCLCSFPFIALLCPTKTGWAQAEQLSSQFLPPTFKGQGLTDSNIPPRVHAVNAKPQKHFWFFQKNSTFPAFSINLVPFEGTAGKPNAASELQLCQCPPPSPQPTPHSCYSRIKPDFIKFLEKNSENKPKKSTNNNHHHHQNLELV